MKNILIALLAVTTLVMCLAACKMNNSDKSENSGIRSENSVTVSELEESNNGIIGDKEDLTSGDESGSPMEDIVSNTESTIKDIGDNVGSTVEDIGEDVGSTVENIGEGVGSTVEDIGEGVGSVVEDIGEGAGNTAEDITERAKRDTSVESSQQS